MSIMSTYYLLWLLQSLILLPGGFITLLHCNRAPVSNLCSLSVILHSKSYEYSACQWAVEFIWLPSTTFHCNSCLPPQEGTLISSCVCFKMNQTVVEHVVYWLDSMISSTHSDKYDKWQAYSTCWPLCFSMGVSTVWYPAIVEHVHSSLFAWVVTNQWATKNSSTLTLHPGYALWDIPLFFQIEAKYLTCREQLQAKQLRHWLKLMKTLYMVCYAQVDW